MLSAVQFTTVVPVAKVLPDEGVHETEGVGWLGELALYVTTGLQVTISAGHVMLTAFASPTSNSLKEISPVACTLVEVTVPVVVAVQVEGELNFLTT